MLRFTAAVTTPQLLQGFFGRLQPESLCGKSYAAQSRSMILIRRVWSRWQVKPWPEKHSKAVNSHWSIQDLSALPVSWRAFTDLLCLCGGCLNKTLSTGQWVQWVYRYDGWAQGPRCMRPWRQLLFLSYQGVHPPSHSLCRASGFSRLVAGGLDHVAGGTRLRDHQSHTCHPKCCYQ